MGPITFALKMAQVKAIIRPWLAYAFQVRSVISLQSLTVLSPKSWTPNIKSLNSEH